MDTFSIGQTVTRKGTEVHGLIVEMHMHNRNQMINVFHTRKTPPITYYAYQLQPYVVQSPDIVLLMDDHGHPWAYEVMDVSADGQSVLLMEDGTLGYVRLSEVTRVIPASIARLMRLYGEK